MLRRRRHRRWIAFLALIGLLFQQVAMAAYVCPLDVSTGETAVDASVMPPCHSAQATDKARCHQHCHPLTQSTDHAQAPAVPPATLPPSTWVEPTDSLDLHGHVVDFAVTARAAAPPLIVQHCTLLI